MRFMVPRLTSILKSEFFNSSAVGSRSRSNRQPAEVHIQQRHDGDDYLDEAKSTSSSSPVA
jgi:hypothetical protein